MTFGYPRSPRVQKGGLVSYQVPDPRPNIIVFQYNPDEVTHSLQGKPAGGGGRGDATRVNGPPEETFSFAIEIDAVDQLEHPTQNATTVANGLYPIIGVHDASCRCKCRACPSKRRPSTRS
jgi:hypothetical protein